MTFLALLLRLCFVYRVGTILISRYNRYASAICGAKGKMWRLEATKVPRYLGT